MVSVGQRRQRRSALLDGRERRPEALQRVERLAEEAVDARVVELLQGDARREDHVGVARTVPRHLVPDVLTVALPGVGADLVSQLVVVGDVVAVGAAKPLVDVAPAAAALIPHPLHGAVAHREGGLQSAAERRQHRLRHHGIALHGPDAHEEQPDGRALLAKYVAQYADQPPGEVVVLHGVAVFVRDELLVPRHRVGVDGRRGEELHTLRQVHDQSVREEVLGVHDEGDAHRAVAETVGDVGLHGAHVKERARGHARHRIGIDHPHVGRADRRPLHRSVRSPRIVLRRCAPGRAQRPHEGQDKQQALHVNCRLSCSRSRPP